MMSDQFAVNDLLKLDMTGLELARGFYEDYGKPMLEIQFSDYYDKIAVGAVGEGSDCFGFDDKISMDHDYGPAFTIWLPEKEYREIGEFMQKAYNNLPPKYKGVSAQISRQQAAGRKGVVEINRFYEKFLGRGGLPETEIAWFGIPEYSLAACTNGQVFEDNLGEFSKIREKLLAYYPEDVRLKKIAATAVRIAHSGQCNYARVMRRYDAVAGHFAIDEFLKNCVSMLYLLNRTFCPYYKWMWRGLERFSGIDRERELIYKIAAHAIEWDKWKSDRWDTYQLSLNTNDEIILMAEELSALIIAQLKDQGLSSGRSDYLEEHGYEVQKRIKNPQIASMPVLFG